MVFKPPLPGSILAMGRGRDDEDLPARPSGMAIAKSITEIAIGIPAMSAGLVRTKYAEHCE
jgi:hypothetical protein